MSAWCLRKKDMNLQKVYMRQHLYVFVHGFAVFLAFIKKKIDSQFFRAAAFNRLLVGKKKDKI